MVLGFGSGGGKKRGGGQKDSGQGKKGSGGGKRPASKSPPKDASQRQRTEASSSTDPPRGGEQLGNWLTKPKSAAQGPPGRAAQPSNRPVVSAPTRHMQQPEQRTSTQRNPKRRIWYYCVCLRQREASPPRQNEMGNDICGNVAKKGPCEHRLSSCGDKTCFTKQADEERPMWFLGLSKVSYWIPWGPRGGPWKSYEPFGLTLRLGKDRWPARYCCACRTNKSSLWREPVRTRYCLHQKFPGDKKRCGTPPCKECTLVPDWWCHMCLQHGHPDARKPVRTELCDRVADSRTGALCGHQAYKYDVDGAIWVCNAYNGCVEDPRYWPPPAPQQPQPQHDHYQQAPQLTLPHGPRGQVPQPIQYLPPAPPEFGQTHPPDDRNTPSPPVRYRY